MGTEAVPVEAARAEAAGATINTSEPISANQSQSELIRAHQLSSEARTRPDDTPDNR